MDDSLDRHAEGITPRRLLRRFREVMDVQDTPTPFRTRRTAAVATSAQNTHSASKRSKTSRQSTGGKSMRSDVSRQQSTSFMDQSLNVSVIQGGNQTYANLVAPDSDSSSISSPVKKRTSKFDTKKKRKLEDASLPADVVPKPPSKKKSKKTILPPSDTSTSSRNKEAVSGAKDSDTTHTATEETQAASEGPSTADGLSPIIPRKVAFSRGRAEGTGAVHLSTIQSPNVSTLSALSAESDGTYNFTLENDETLPNIVETKRRFGSQTTARKLNLPSIIDILPTKQKPTDSGVAADAEDALVTSGLQAPTPVKSPPTSREALEESSKLNITSKSINDGVVPPPVSFRDDETSTTGTMREANLSKDKGNNTLLVLTHQEEPSVTQDLLPVTPSPVQGTPPAPQSALPGHRKSMGQVTVGTTITPTRTSLRKSISVATSITPTRSSPRRNISQISVATSTTPIRSSPRRNVSQSSVAISTTPIKSAQRKIVDQSSVAISTTPTRSSPRRNVSQSSIAISTTPTRSAQRKSVGEVIATASPTRSSPRKSVGEVIATTSPTKAAQRKSVGEASTTTSPATSAEKSVGVGVTSTSPVGLAEMSAGEALMTTSPAKSAEKSVSEVIATTSPTRSAEKSAGEVVTTASPTSSAEERASKVIAAISPTRSVEKSVGEASTTTSPTRSAEKSVGEALMTTSPTRSSPRSVGEASTTTSPAKSAEKSVDEAVTTPSPTRSAEKSPGEAVTMVSPTRSSPRKSVGENVITTSSTRSAEKSADEAVTTRSSPRRSVGEAVAMVSPTRSSPRKSKSEVIVATTHTRSPQRKSVVEVASSISPMLTAQRESVVRNVTSVLVSPQTDDAVESETRSAMSHASKTGQQGFTATVSPPSGSDKRDELIFLSENESEESGKKISRSLLVVAGGALPEDAIEEAPLSESESESSYANLLRTSASTLDTQKGETSFPKTKDTPALNKQTSAPISTTRVRQMTMKEFLEKLKTKPVPPPVPGPKPLLGSVFGTSAPSKTPARAPQRLKQKRSRKAHDLPATLPRSVTKELFTHFAKCRVTSKAVDEVVKSSEIFWQNLTRDLSAIMSSRKNPTQIEAKDVDKLMRRQGVTTSKQSLNALVEELLPMEMWNLFMSFPDPAKIPFQPFTGPVFNPEQADPEEDESEGE